MKKTRTKSAKRNQPPDFLLNIAPPPPPVVFEDWLKVIEKYDTRSKFEKGLDRFVYGLESGRHEVAFWCAVGVESLVLAITWPLLQAPLDLGRWLARRFPPNVRWN